MSKKLSVTAQPKVTDRRSEIYQYLDQTKIVSSGCIPEVVDNKAVLLAPTDISFSESSVIEIDFDFDVEMPSRFRFSGQALNGLVICNIDIPKITFFSSNELKFDKGQKIAELWLEPIEFFNFILS